MPRLKFNQRHFTPSLAVDNFPIHQVTETLEYRTSLEFLKVSKNGNG
ncbi:MAG: hypothetical protein NZM15_08175 [Flavobacteriales bacterium]|nr:hypothetical protein [Flavobacteriales bacterium]MDW8432661.1 hypothetical protein [Flavobacteriales bacterium]